MIFQRKFSISTRSKHESDQRALVITNSFDAVGRLTGTWLRYGATLINSNGYTYNVGGQRTAQQRSEGVTVDYAYDDLGQLKTALANDPNGTNRLHERLGYHYDAAGNLQRLTNGALVRSMGVNALNQLTEATRSGTLTVAGYTTTAATNVTVNDFPATQYVDQTFASAGHSLTDGVNTFTAIAQAASGRKSTNVVAAYLPATGSFSYDLNGNLLSDGLRAFDYDDENQLIRVLVTNAWKSEFVYDGKLRRRVRKEYTWQSNAWVQTNEVRYVYDGNLVLQERNANNAPVVTYTRGTDLSGSLEGAGGIGGLLAQTRPLPGTPPNYYYQADGNGNIVVLINTNGLEVARYVYDPYGNVLGLRGNLAELNLHRFSSKEAHPNSGLVYYLYRYYEPTLQRWINRDPVQEYDGFNLYRFCGNRLPSRSDPLGLTDEGGGCPGSTDLRAKCYQYAANNYGKYSDIPGARGGQRCDSRPITCTKVKDGANKDGLEDVPDSGKCPEGQHKVAYAVQEGGDDYHWFRESDDGTFWCHKFFWYDKPSSVDGQGKKITDPAAADLNFPQIGRQPAGKFKFCGYLCSPNVWEAKR